MLVITSFIWVSVEKTGGGNFLLVRLINYISAVQPSSDLQSLKLKKKLKIKY